MGGVGGAAIANAPEPAQTPMARSKLLNPAEESIAIYERGEALRDHCDRLLKAAEAKVEKLTLGADGAPTGTTPLDKN